MKRVNVFWSVMIAVVLSGLVFVGTAFAATLEQAGVPADLTPATVAVALAGLVSILATVVPSFNTWFAAKTEETKQSIMAIATAVIAVGLYVLACTPSLGFTYVSCPVGGWWSLLSVIVLSWTANQGTDRIIPKPASVKAARLAGRPGG